MAAMPDGERKNAVAALVPREEADNALQKIAN